MKKQKLRGLPSESEKGAKRFTVNVQGVANGEVDVIYYKTEWHDKKKHQFLVTFYEYANEYDRDKVLREMSINRQIFTGRVDFTDMITI